MTSSYDSRSCNPLEKPFYRPVEAAIRWCGLIAHEGEILGNLGTDIIPKSGQFPMWKCLQANTEKILDAIENRDIAYGRDGKTVTPGEPVAAARRTVRHTDLKQWMTTHFPDQKPAFLFDEIERKTHAAVNIDSFQALQVDRDAARAELAVATRWADDYVGKHKAAVAELDSLRAAANKGVDPGPRSEATYQSIIGGLIDLMLGKTPAGKPGSVYMSQAAIIDALSIKFENVPGMSKRNLELKFAEARRMIGSN